MDQEDGGSHSRVPETRVPTMKECSLLSESLRMNYTEKEQQQNWAASKKKKKELLTPEKTNH